MLIVSFFFSLFSVLACLLCSGAYLTASKQSSNAADVQMVFGDRIYKSKVTNDWVGAWRSSNSDWFEHFCPSGYAKAFKVRGGGLVDGITLVCSDNNSFFVGGDGGTEVITTCNSFFSKVVVKWGTNGVGIVTPYCDNKKLASSGSGWWDTGNFETTLECIDNQKIYGFYGRKNTKEKNRIDRLGFHCAADSTSAPTVKPTPSPTNNPTQKPTFSPSPNPTATPTEFPIASPTVVPSASPTRTQTDLGYYGSAEGDQFGGYCDGWSEVVDFNIRAWAVVDKVMLKCSDGKELSGGGEGGRLFENSCPAKYAKVVVKYGPNGVGTLTPYCSGVKQSVAGDASLPNTGNEEEIFECPPNQYIYGIYGRQKNNLVTGIGIWCVSDATNAPTSFPIASPTNAST